MRSLIYLYDPLCGWCYAATPAIARLRANSVPVKLLPTGLFSNTGRVMTAEFAAYAWANDQRIAAMTGQTFTDAYRQHVLQAPGTSFDSAAAVLALTAVAMDDPEGEADALQALQEARYIGGLDITDSESIVSILQDAGFQIPSATSAAGSAALLAANASRLAAGQTMMREVGGSGVPTLVLVEDATRRLLDSKLLYGSADELLTLFRSPQRVVSEALH